MVRTKGLVDSESDDRPNARPRNSNPPPFTAHGRPSGGSLISESDEGTIATADIPGPPILRSQEHAVQRDPRLSQPGAVPMRNPTRNEATSANSESNATRINNQVNNDNFNQMEQDQFRVKAYMAALGTQENVNILSTPPGAVPVQGIHSQDFSTPQDHITNHQSSHWDNIGEASVTEELLATESGTPLVAQLAPDEADVAARVAERLERQMTEQWQERLKEEVQAQLHHQRQTHVVAEAVVTPAPHPDEEAPTTSARVRPLKKKGPSSNPTTEDSTPSTRTKEDNFMVCGLRRRTWGLVLMVILVLIAGAVVGVVWYLQSRDEDEDPEPTRSPTTPTQAPSAAPTVNGNLDYLLQVLGPSIAPTVDDQEKLASTKTPQYKALQWLAEDPYSSNPESLPTSVLLERYVLAVLYYSTSGPNWQQELFFLQEVNACDWYSLEPSKNGENPPGVYCDEIERDIYLVTALYLKGTGLVGQLPWEIGLLSNLQTLELDNNFLLGTIPSEIRWLQQLRVLWINSNALTGNLPNAIELPPSLESLDLNGNALSGTLPDEWSEALPRLFYVSLSGNELQGSLPASWQTLSQLSLLDIGDNALTGTLEDAFGIPWPKLNALFVESNLLTGSLPPTLGQITTLQQLWIHNNQFTGSIPKEFSKLTLLQSFFFDNNQLVGSVETIFCSNVVPEFLRGDCLEVTCSCCTTCCSEDGC